MKIFALHYESVEPNHKSILFERVIGLRCDFGDRKAIGALASSNRSHF